MATISPTPKLQFLDANGNPLSYGFLYTYSAGTTTPKTTYTTAAQATANTNPIVLDSRGEADVWLLAGEAYKFTLQNSSGVLQYTVDQITAAGTMSTQNASNVNITGGSISGISLAGTITGNVIGNVTGNVTGNLTGDVSGGSIVGTSYNGGQLAGFRNKIINGNFLIWQRNSTFTSQALNANTFYADRWRSLGSGAAVLTISRSTDVPNDQLLYSCKIETTTADATVDPSDYYYFYQPIEGYNIRDFYDKTFTLSFWVKSSKAGVYCVSFRSNSSDPIYIAEFVVSTIDTWEFKTITVVNGLPGATGTWQWAAATGLRVGWALQAGSTYGSGNAGLWYSSGFDYATSNQVNVFDTIGNSFFLAGVQVEIGATATPFERRTFGVELALSTRYYEKSFLYQQAPVQNIGATVGAAYAIGQVTNQAFSALVSFAVQKRTNPTIVTYAPDAASANWSTNTTTPTVSTANIGDRGFAVIGGTSVTAGNGYSIHWAASAELG